MKLRIATFNVENLFTRFNFAAFEDAGQRTYLPPVVNFLHDFDAGNPDSFQRFRGLVETATVVESDEKRQHTALVLTEADADIVCLQEVDSIAALRKFQEFYLKKTSDRAYHQAALHEGNDFRGIDNAVMAEEEVSDRNLVLYTRSNAHIRPSRFGSALLDAFRADYPLIKPLLDTPNERGKRIFARDCLEVDIKIDGKELTLFVCHFKSMSGGREETIGRRQLEALAVRQIIRERFGNNPDANWLVLGDLNDYREQIKVSSRQRPDGTFEETMKVLHGTPGFASGLDPLLDDGFGFSLLDSVPESERWTHYFSGERTKTVLDQMIASPRMRDAALGSPRIVRGGQPFRVPNTAAIPRYPRVGWDRPKASDHCPVVAEFDVDLLSG